MLLAPLENRRKRPTQAEAEAEGVAFMDLMGMAQGGLPGGSAG